MVIQNAKHRQEAVDKIRQAVEAGKTVVAPCWGDAMVYGTLWYLEMLPKDFPSEVIPGVGAFEAGSAALKKSTTFGWDTNSVILTMGDFVGRVDTNEKLMRIGTSLVIYTMHLDYPKVFGQLKRHYPANTPSPSCVTRRPGEAEGDLQHCGPLPERGGYQNPRRPAHPIRGQVPGEADRRASMASSARVGSSSASTGLVTRLPRPAIQRAWDRPSPRCAHPRCQDELTCNPPGPSLSKEKDFQMKLGAHLWIALAVLLPVALQAAALKGPNGGHIVYASGKDAGTVVFSHRRHGKAQTGYKCAACHPAIPEKRGTVTMAANNEGKACGTCHNGRTKAPRGEAVAFASPSARAAMRRRQSCGLG